MENQRQQLVLVESPAQAARHQLLRILNPLRVPASHVAQALRQQDHLKFRPSPGFRA